MSCQGCVGAVKRVLTKMEGCLMFFCSLLSLCYFLILNVLVLMIFMYGKL
ncbi:hypothetical protein BHE74_00030414 [Ensete ventricosum]|nr:hypothetical protein BHE74_00030414 [Ensete ventricosum]